MPIKRLWPASVLILLASCSEPPAGVMVPPPGLTPAVNASSPPTSRPGANQAKTDDIVAEAEKTSSTGDLAGAAGLLEEVLKRDPLHRKALFLVAAIDIDRGTDLERPKSSELYHLAAEHVRQLRNAYPKDLNEREQLVIREALYHDARTFAFLHQPDKALQTLADAVDAGYSRLIALQTEEEFDPLRTNPKFQEILAKVETRARARAKEDAKTLMGENPPTPFDFQLPGLDDKTVALSDFRGKVVLVDFWGTWCPPCRQEIPHLVKLYKEFHDKGLEVVGLTYERVPQEEVKASIQAFVKKNGIPYPCLIGNDKTKEQLADVDGFPTTLFLDRSGKVRAKIAGFAPQLSLVMEEIISTLLAEGASPLLP